MIFISDWSNWGICFVLVPNRNLLQKTTHPDAATESRTYDGVGNLLTHTDEENKTTSYTYDKENRQLSSLFAGQRTTRLYSPIGSLISITNPEGNCRIMAFDDFSRLIIVADDPTGPIGSMTALDPR
ncbi:MAG: hypothetical protein GY869_00485, partial [Planctomycetes bacterium]|nr:hypothetical protein [Planctomycetota bacterium]